VKKNLKSLFKKADTLVREYTRKRDENTCCRCGKPVFGSGSHPSHNYPRGAYKSMRWIPDNILTMCFRCHRYWWHMDPINADKWFNEEYPDRAEKLLLASQSTEIVNEEFMKKTIEYLESL
jgi:5-methylcytosine-specific restriction endonuclease McrA